MNKETQENLLKLVRRNYEEIAEDFDATRKKELWPELLKLAETVKDGDRVLDAGCGNGRLAGALAGKKIYYLGVDGSEKLIDAARKNILDSRLRGNDKKESGNDKRGVAPRNDNFNFVVGDILELDKLAEKDFDYIFCAAVLHHLPGEDLRIKALGQMKNKLARNGKIIITVWNLWSQRKFRKLIFKYGLLKLAGLNKMDFGDILFDWKNEKGESISQRYYHAFTNGELKKLAAQAGLKMEKLYQDQYNYYIVLGN